MIKYSFNTKLNVGAVVVAQLVERSLSIPEVRGSNSDIGKFFYWILTVNCIEKTKIKKKRPGLAHFYETKCCKSKSLSFWLKCCGWLERFVVIGERRKPGYSPFRWRHCGHEEGKSWSEEDRVQGPILWRLFSENYCSFLHSQRCFTNLHQNIYDIKAILRYLC